MHALLLTLLTQATPPDTATVYCRDVELARRVEVHEAESWDILSCLIDASGGRTCAPWLKLSSRERKALRRAGAFKVIGSIPGNHRIVPTLPSLTHLAPDSLWRRLIERHVALSELEVARADRAPGLQWSAGGAWDAGAYERLRTEQLADLSALKPSAALVACLAPLELR